MSSERGHWGYLPCIGLLYQAKWVQTQRLVSRMGLLVLASVGTGTGAVFPTWACWWLAKCVWAQGLCVPHGAAGGGPSVRRHGGFVYHVGQWVPGCVSMGTRAVCCAWGCECLTE